MFINLSRIKRLLNSTPVPPFFSDWMCDEILTNPYVFIMKLLHLQNHDFYRTILQNF